MEKKEFETQIHRNFPTRLRVALDFRGVTIISLADMCNISRNSIHRYLSTERVSDFETMIKIAKALQLPQEFFFEDIFVLEQKVYSWTKENELQEISVDTLLDEDNETAMNGYLGLINECIKSVDEPTKRAMNKRLFNVLDDIYSLQKDYMKNRKSLPIF
ncbi:helix-turn-helix transcriptional regulator [[Clostridium] innocuum]|nr:helix-turn-helix transcriptional regulator [[Clostridium] innocuum]